MNRDKEGREEARQQKQSATRTQILIAAERIFAERGQAGARIEEIVTESGVNVRMVYHHFGNKDGLYDAVIAETLAPVMAEISKIDSAEPLTALHRIHDRLLDACEENKNFVSLLNWESACGWASLSRAIPEEEMIFTVMKDLVRKGVESGQISESIDPELIVASIFGSVVMMQQFSRSEIFKSLNNLKPSQYKQKLWQLVAKGLGSPERLPK